MPNLLLLLLTHKRRTLLCAVLCLCQVVLADNTSGRHGTHRAAVGAFVMPNAAIDPATPLTAFTVPLEALESVAGASKDAWLHGAAPRLLAQRCC